ncbi:MAG: phosphoenolpyruvate carboxykinase (ATP), partial [Candidatus Micrarchaeia archaeon]
IHMWKSLLLPVNKITKTKHGVKKHASPHNEGELLPDGVEPDTILIMVPEWCEVKGKKDPLILVDPEGATTFALGVDYVGEMKKGHLRMVMYLQKKKYRRSDGKEGGLGLHAGAKLIRIRDKRGKLVEKGLLFLGLTATGKTTHTFHHWWLDEKNGETIIIKQDDFGTLTKEGKFIGTEQGCYLKLDGLDEKSQPLLYNAVRKGGKSVSIENVYIDPQTLGPDFKRFDHPYVGKTTNSRGIIPSVLFGKYFDPDNIDVEEVDVIVFITRRNTIVPPVAKLKTPEQAAAYFMLGESVHSSGSTKDPNKIGQSIREVGTNPFIVGPEYEEGNIFLEILKEINKRRRKEGKPEVEVYLFNTGRVGAQDARDEKTGRKITIEDSVNIIKAIAKGTIEWEEDPDWCYLVPKKIEGMDYSQFDPRKYYTSEKYAELTEELRKERMEWLKKFEREGLVPEIAEEIEPMGAEKP